MVEFSAEDLELLARCYAKSDKTTILQHTNSLVQLSEKLTAYGVPFNDVLDRQLLYLAVKYHDYGKLNKEFQIALRDKSKAQILYHQLISPLYFLDRVNALDETKSLIVGISIIHHHARQRELLSKYGYGKIMEFLNKLHSQSKLPGLSNFNNAIKEYRRLLQIYLHNKDKKSFQVINMRIELISGYLLKVDHSASGGLPVELPAIDSDRESLFLKAISGQSLNGVQGKAKACEDSLCLIADTGSGKTGAGIVWSKRKMFYVLPVRTSVNAMHETLSNVFGKERIGLLHSSSLYHLLKNDDNPLMTYDNSRNLAMPVTVTTADQLFVAAYKFPTYEKIYATLSYSDVIIDEIQGFAPEQLVPILHAVKETKELGARYLIITATLPGFLKKRLSDCGIDTVETEADKTKRHILKLCDVNIETLCDEITEKGQRHRVLVIVNTVKKAKFLYSRLKERGNVKLLHSRFILQHRVILEDEIKYDFKAATPVIWITTQLVEASLDISYQYLFTEVATIDSLVQRMGRVYRHQTDDYIGDPNIIIATKTDDRVYDKAIVEKTVSVLHPIDGKFFVSEVKRGVVEDIYSKENLASTKYWKRWADTEKRLNNPIIQDVLKMSGKGDAQDMFRYVPGINAIPDSIYNKNLDKIQRSLNILKKPDNRIEKVLAIEFLKNLEVSVPVYFHNRIFAVNSRYGIFRAGLDYRFDEQNREGLIYPDKENKELGVILD